MLKRHLIVNHAHKQKANLQGSALGERQGGDGVEHSIQEDDVVEIGAQKCFDKSDHELLRQDVLVEEVPQDEMEQA